MIFLSHTKIDKDIVEPIAKKLADSFGKENVFYDSWSIQPGEGIIDKMNEGLSKCSFFFFFVSKNSIASKMCALEWQNTLMNSCKKEIKFIPIRIDDCTMPFILSQKLYIDMYSYGFEVGMRQIFDVINGENTFHAKYPTYSNLKAFITKKSRSNFVIEIKAINFMEPISSYGIAIDNELDNIEYSLPDISMHNCKNIVDMNFTNGEKHNVLELGIEKATTPSFPFKIILSTKNSELLKLVCILHEQKAGCFASIPIEYIK